jgi:hypothetical protein
VSLRILAFDDAAERKIWDETLADLPARLRDVFATSAYALAWQDRGDGRAMGALFRNDDGSGELLYPFLLRSLADAEHLGPGWDGYHDITSPPGYGGPIGSWPEEPQAFFAAFRRELGEWCREHQVVSEFIRFHPLLDNQLGWEPHLEVAAVGSVVWRKLERDTTSMLDELSLAARHNVRLALEAGLSGGVERGEDAYERFAELAATDALRRGRSPREAFDARFLTALRRRLQNDQTLVGVRHRDSLVSAALFVTGRTFAHYFASATDLAQSRLRPNNLLFFASLQWATGSGSTVLNLGGGHGSEDEFLRFKAGFSHQRATRYVGRVIHLYEDYARALDEHDQRGICLDCDYFPAYRGPLPGGA